VFTVDAADNRYLRTAGIALQRMSPAGVITDLIDQTGDGAGNLLSAVNDVAVGSDGTVYVVGRNSRNAFKIVPGGSITEIIAHGAPINLIDPEHIAVDSSGTVYVAGNNLFHITASGVITEIQTALSGFAGLAVDSADNLYFTTVSSAYRLSPGGSRIQLLAPSDIGNGANPEAIAVDGSGNAYVATADSNKVFRISSGGSVTEIIDSTGDGLGNQLLRPAALTTDASGNVYVVGNSSQNAFVITPGGSITEIIDETGDGIATPLVFPSHIAVDSTGNVHISGFEITPGGLITALIGPFVRSPESLVADGSGNIYVAGRSTNNVVQLAPDGTATAIVGPLGDNANSPLDLPVSLAIDDLENIYVSGWRSLDVLKVTPGGAISEAYDSRLWDMATDSLGNIYGTTGFDQVRKITPAGVVTTILDATGDGAGNAFRDGRAIVVDANDNIFVAGFDTNNVFKITPGGAITQVLDALGTCEGHLLDGPGGLAVDTDGNLYVTSVNNDNVFKVTPAGVVTLLIDATGDGRGNALSEPSHVAVDAAGNVYVTGVDSNKVFMITSDSTIAKILDSSGDGMGGSLQTPADVTVGPAGNVFVSGWSSNNVFKIGDF
jgi:sugar lactone lactonase YvrE